MADRTLLDQIPPEKAGAPLGAFFGQTQPRIALPGETCRSVAARLAITGLDRLPVAEDDKTYRLVGIVSRHDLLKPSMSVFAEEHEQEQFRRVWIPRSTRLAPTNKRHDVPDKRADVGR
jgi:hypothetical protein